MNTVIYQNRTYIEIMNPFCEKESTDSIYLAVEDIIMTYKHWIDECHLPSFENLENWDFAEIERIQQTLPNATIFEGKILGKVVDKFLFIDPEDTERYGSNIAGIASVLGQEDTSGVLADIVVNADTGKILPQPIYNIALLKVAKAVEATGLYPPFGQEWHTYMMIAEIADRHERQEFQ